VTAPDTVDLAIYGLLSEADELARLSNGRVYPIIGPQNVINPFITYERSSTVRVSALADDTNLAHAIFQISAWSNSRDEVVNTALQIRGVMQRFKGTNSGITIEDVYIQNEVDLYDSVSKLFQVSMDFEIWYRE